MTDIAGATIAPEPDAIDDDRKTAVLTGTTTHEGGVVMHWTQTSLGFMVIDGLPVIRR